MNDKTVSVNLAPHQARVVAERAELAERITKLESFIDTRLFETLDGAERFLLSSQLCAMKDYAFALALRIDRFTADNARDVKSGGGHAG